MTPSTAVHVDLAGGEAALGGAGSGLASLETWAIALVALALLLATARWATSRRRRP